MNDTPTQPPAEPVPSRRLRVLYTALLVLVIALIAAVVVWIAGGSGGGGGGEETVEAPGAPRIVSAGELGEAAAASGGPVYWVGERPGAELELSEFGEARAYVRYLTGGVEAGDPKAAYLTIGTYREPHAYEELKADAKRGGGKLRKAPGGLSAWVDPASPTSVYLAKPGSEYQVEVYDPSPEEALAVALSPDLQPVPAG
jgi:hypothetical protein